MLTLTIQGTEMFDEASNTFTSINDTTIELEHSLVSLSKWEATWEKPFLGPEKKTSEETLGYIQCMTITPNVPPEVYQRLTDDHLEQVNHYIDRKMSATWFKEDKKPASREIITAEVIYHWMIALNIPLEWENRHLNRLFTLVKVCNEKNNPDKKKMSHRDLAARNRQLNAERKAKLNTTG